MLENGNGGKGKRSKTTAQAREREADRLNCWEPREEYARELS